MLTFKEIVLVNISTTWLVSIIILTKADNLVLTVLLLPIRYCSTLATTHLCTLQSTRDPHVLPTGDGTL